jgi:hypothetical protein
MMSLPLAAALPAAVYRARLLARPLASAARF